MITYLQPTLNSIRARLLPFGEEPHDAQPAPTALYAKPRAISASNDVLSMGAPFMLAPAVEDLLSRRAAIERTLHTLKPGVEGQIVCIESLMHDELRSGQAVLPSPAYVLLDKPTFDQSSTNDAGMYLVMSSVWGGWLVCPDVAYMNEWDVLLNDDAMREDACAFVQTWNRVEVYLPCVHRVAGLVQRPILNSIRHLSRCFEAGLDDDSPDARTTPGELVQRRLPHGSWICTGTVQDESNADDPRNDYVRLYGQFAELFSQAVWSMIRDFEAELTAKRAVDLASGDTPQRGDASKLLNLARPALEFLGFKEFEFPFAKGASARTQSPTGQQKWHEDKAKEVFVFEWRQDDHKWTMKGRMSHSGEQVLLLSEEVIKSIPQFVAWKNPRTREEERLAVRRIDGDLVVDLDLIKAQLRARKVKTAQGEERVACLPVVHFGKGQDL